MKNFGKFLAILGLVLLFLYPPAGVFFILVGLVMFAIGKPNSTIEAKKRKGQERPCPFCKEPVLKSAIKCKHCQSDIPAEKEKEKDKIKRPIKLVIVLVILIAVVMIVMIKNGSSDHISETPEIGEIGHLDNGKEMINLAIDEESHSKMLDAPQVGWGDLVSAGKVFSVNCKISVRVIDGSIFLRRVRILEGPQKDLTGWCSYVYIKR